MEAGKQGGEPLRMCTDLNTAGYSTMSGNLFPAFLGATVQLHGGRALAAGAYYCLVSVLATVCENSREEKYE
jgi:hypothetical protein